MSVKIQFFGELRTCFNCQKLSNRRNTFASKHTDKALWNTGNFTTTAATMTAKILKTIKHKTREANLQAAKQAIRTNRKAYLQRRNAPGKDVIDVVLGSDIIERHICKTNEPYAPVRRTIPFCIEELALYK